MQTQVEKDLQSCRDLVLCGLASCSQTEAHAADGRFLFTPSAASRYVDTPAVTEYRSLTLTFAEDVRKIGSKQENIRMRLRIIMESYEGQAYLLDVDSPDGGNTFLRNRLLGTPTNGLAICLCCPRNMLAWSVTPKKATRCQPRSAMFVRS